LTWFGVWPNSQEHGPDYPDRAGRSRSKPHPLVGTDDSATLKILNRSLLFAAVILFTVTAIKHAPAVWRGPPEALATLDPETRDWVRDLTNKIGGLCCDRADGFPVEVDGWDMAGTVDDTSGMTEVQAGNARSGYRVRLADGKWHDVPNFALINPKTNKLGYAVVWLVPAVLAACVASGATAQVPEQVFRDFLGTYTHHPTGGSTARSGSHSICIPMSCRERRRTRRPRSTLRYKRQHRLAGSEAWARPGGPAYPGSVGSGSRLGSDGLRGAYELPPHVSHDN
jgi:hypothetical protein